MDATLVGSTDLSLSSSLSLATASTHGGTKSEKFTESPLCIQTLTFVTSASPLARQAFSERCARVRVMRMLCELGRHAWVDVQTFAPKLPWSMQLYALEYCTLALLAFTCYSRWVIAMEIEPLDINALLAICRLKARDLLSIF